MRHRLFYGLLLLNLGLALYLADRHDQQWSWRSSRTELDEQSIQLLKQLPYPIKLYAFMPDYPVQKKALREFIAPYQQYAQIELKFIDPSKQPQLSRSLGIRRVPQYYLQYAGKSRLLDQIDAHHFINALARLSLKEQNWLINLKGHGEASLLGQANFDLGLLGQKLKQIGYQIIDLDLSQGGIPRNARLLMLAAPQIALSTAEQQQLIDYLEQGGALIWLADGIIAEDLAAYLGLKFLKGTVVDAAAAQLGIDQPTIAVARPVSDHKIVQNLKRAVLMPEAKALQWQAGDWQAQPLLQTGAQSWNETGTLKGVIRRQPEQGEQAGPLTTAYLLHRQKTWVLVVGDNDFASNAFIGNLDNQAFILNAIHFISQNQPLLHIPEPSPPDQIIAWSRSQLVWLGAAHLILLPLLLILIGLWLKYYRMR